MNEPLRTDGLVLFQANWGPQNAPPGTPLFSGFAVVRNPSDYWPLYACIVIGLGLLGVFLPRLFQFAGRQQRQRAGPQSES